MLTTGFWDKAEPPLHVVSLRVLPIAPKNTFRVNIHFNSEAPSLQILGRSRVFLDRRRVTTATRIEIERELWALYERLNQVLDGPQSSQPRLATPKGLGFFTSQALALTPRDLADLAGGAATAYVMGEIDYGSGVIEFCGFHRPVDSTAVFLCASHNGLRP